MRTAATYAPGGLLFDWIHAGLSAVFLIGLYVDGWAHNHGKADETFFTLWHAIFYAGYLLLSLFLLGSAAQQMARGRPLNRALPRGYWIPMLGVIGFALGGLGDMLWHELLGIEVNLDALLSPTHLVLATSMILIFSGPLNAGWAREEKLENWRTLGPALIAATTILAVLMFFTQFAHPVVHLLAAQPMDHVGQALGVASITLQSALTTGMILFLLRRWRLPFGAITLLVAVSALLISFMRDTWQIAPAVALGGLLGDVLAVRLKPSVHDAGRLHAFAFLLPLVVYGMYFAGLLTSQGRLYWSAHMAIGAIFMGAISGLLLSLLIAPPMIARS